MRRITLNYPGARVDMATVGPDWCGLIYFRLYAQADAWKSYGGIKLLWMNVVFCLPAAIMNLWSKPREEWG